MSSSKGLMIALIITISRAKHQLQRPLARALGAVFVSFMMLMNTSHPAFAQTASNTTTKTSVDDASDTGYQVGPEDMLDISVWKEEGLKKEVLVRPDGGLSFPLAGDFHVAGLTADQIRKEIAHRLEKYIPDPVVSVSVLKAANYKVYVTGRVNKPGEFSVGQAIDVLQAISMAGGLTPFAVENEIKIIRKVNGRPIAIPFEYAKVQRGQALDQIITLKSGDTVVVP